MKKLKLNFKGGLTKSGVIAGTVLAVDFGLQKLNAAEFMQNKPKEDGTISKWNVKKIGAAGGTVVLGIGLSAMKNEHASNVGAGLVAAGSLSLKNLLVLGFSDVGMGADNKSSASKYVGLYDRTFSGEFKPLAGDRAKAQPVSIV